MDKKGNVLLEKTFAFAVRGFNVAKYLRENRQEYIASKQFARCSMSVGANAEEANASQSKKEFIAKLQISYKEAKEAHYWVRLLESTSQITATEAHSLKHDIDEICKIISSIIMTTQKNHL